MALATLSRQQGDSITFEVNADKVRTWQDFKLSGRSRWATHEVHMAQPKREFLGPGVSSLSLSVRLDAGLGLNPREELDRLRVIRDTGEVVTLVVGGVLITDFVLEGLTEDWRRVDASGAITTAIAELQLEEYV